jgi:hypothetical protein
LVNRWLRLVCTVGDIRTSRAFDPRRSHPGSHGTVAGWLVASERTDRLNAILDHLDPLGKDPPFASS